MKIGFAALILSSLFWSNHSFSQTDSTDLTLTMADPVLETAEDSLLFSSDFFGELSLDFELDDPDSLSSVQIELSDYNSHSVLYRRVYAISELSSLGLLSGSDVTISFGNRELERTYQVHINLLDLEESHLPTITKIIVP